MNLLSDILFDAASQTKSIPPDVFDDGYTFASFHVESLFTNVFIITNLELLNLKSESYKKLIKGTSSKTVFSANNNLYQQIDGVSIGSSHGILLANKIMTEMEKTIIKKFTDDNILFFMSVMSKTH